KISPGVEAPGTPETGEPTAQHPISCPGISTAACRNGVDWLRRLSPVRLYDTREVFKRVGERIWVSPTVPKRAWFLYWSTTIRNESFEIWLDRSAVNLPKRESLALKI